MVFRTFALAGVMFSLSATTMLANSVRDSEPVLRLRFQDPLLASVTPDLRPRFNPALTARAAPMPKMKVVRAGRVGTFAQIATAHPNLVLAVGAMQDRTEIGRQIDHAMLGTGAQGRLHEQHADRAPFIGLGVRTHTAVARGWSADMTIGAGLMNAAEPARLTNATIAPPTSRFDAQARANLRVRYRF